MPTSNPLNPDMSGTQDTTNAQGGVNTHAQQDPAQYYTGTVSTLEPGAPTKHADPAYKVPPKDAPGTIVDTTRTDLPTTNGIAAVAPIGNMAGTIDTVNFTPVLRTTTANTPATPGAAPTVAAKGRGVQVTIVALADPAGATIKGYRVEAARVSAAGKDPGDAGNYGTPGVTGVSTSAAAGVDFIDRGQTSVLMGTLTPGDLYKFRFAGVNDNGTGDYSPWSTAVTPLLPEDNISGTPDAPTYPTAVWEENAINPIYKPDGTQMGAATGFAAVWSGAGPFTLTVTWTAPTTGAAPTSYDVTVTGTAAPLSATNVAALTKAFPAAQTGGTLGSTPKNLVVSVKANPSKITRTAAVTAT